MHARVADAYAGLGMNEEAAREYRKALELCPTFVDIRTKLAATLRDLGDKEAAVQEYQLVKQQAPKYLPARDQPRRDPLFARAARRGQERVGVGAAGGSGQQELPDVPRHHEGVTSTW